MISTPPGKNRPYAYDYSFTHMAYKGYPVSVQGRPNCIIE